MTIFKRKTMVRIKTKAKRLREGQLFKRDSVFDSDTYKVISVEDGLIKTKPMQNSAFYHYLHPETSVFIFINQLYINPNHKINDIIKDN